MHIYHRESVKHLPLPTTLIQELLNEYSGRLKFETVQINCFDAEAVNFMMLEFNIKYGIIYNKRYLSIIHNNPWVERLFCSFADDWHLVLKWYVKLENDGRRTHLKTCPVCFSGGLEYMRYSEHTVFRLTSSALFEKMFKDENLWCTLCKQSPLYDLLTPFECQMKYGSHTHDCCPHGFGDCWNCRRGRRLFRMWYNPLE